MLSINDILLPKIFNCPEYSKHCFKVFFDSSFIQYYAMSATVFDKVCKCEKSSEIKESTVYFKAQAHK